MMKKFNNIWIIALMAALAAGCTRTEFIFGDKEITFAVGKYAAQTKAASIIDVDNVTSFSSKAWLYAEGVDGAQDFFGTGETISYDGSSQWNPSHVYYWPKSENSYVNFVSWHDNNGAPTTIGQKNLEWVGRTINADDNIMFADVAWRYNNNASTYRFNGVQEGVPTLFHHALSRVQINLKATTLQQDGKTYEVSIQSASLKGVYRSGNMRLTTTERTTTGTSAWTSTSNATYLWTPSIGSNADNFELVAENTSLDITTTNTAIMALRSFMPQALGNDIKLTVNFTVTTRSGGNIVSSENGIVSSVVLNKIKNSSNVEITEWLPNRKYIYNFTINPLGQDILLNPTVESDWILGNDISATVE